jgi:hypothetical protein
MVMLKASDIKPGQYRLRDGSVKSIVRVWMGIIYGAEKERTHSRGLEINTKHIWFDAGHYSISGRPHSMDLMERVE